MLTYNKFSIPARSGTTNIYSKYHEYDELTGKEHVD